MSYLKTVLTYARPSEAEVDKSLLESHGITVCLLNADTSRNELGAPFFIRLQVMEDDWARAMSLLRETNPERFGSVERVAAIERQFIGSLKWFALGALLSGATTYFSMHAPVWKEQMRLDEHEPPDLRPVASVSAALLGGLLVTWIRNRFTARSDANGSSTGTTMST